MVRGPVSMVIVGGISLLMVGLIAGGPGFFAKVLPERAVAWLEEMDGLGTASMVSFTGEGGDTISGDPTLAASHLRDSSDGWKPDDQIAALPGGGAAMIGDVIAGHTTRVKSVKPADVVALAEVQGCAFTQPSDGAYVGHAAVGGDSGLDLPIATYGDADLAAAVQQLVSLYRAKGVPGTASLSGLRYQSYDIAVTETARPVYLVLEAGPSQPRIFNIHLAPGARLERVVLIGADQLGVANVPGDVPVEAMRDATARTCGFAPFYPLNPGHLFFQSVQNGAISLEEAQEKELHFQSLAAQWDAVFQAAFGVGAQESLSGNWAGGTIAAVGPLPATTAARAVYAPLDGALLRATVDRYVEFEGQAPEESFDARVKAIATAFAWGDLKNLGQGADY